MKRAARLYSAASVMLVNTLIAFVIVNLAVFAWFRVSDAVAARRQAARAHAFNADGSPVDTGNLDSYQRDWFDFRAYEEAGERYATDVLDDFAKLAAKGFLYQPWVQFSEPFFRGRRLTVEPDPLGFPIRRTPTVPSRVDPHDAVHVFVFGGSTTFGYHVADEDTWPSQLARVLNEKAARARRPYHVTVVNYGRGYFNPSQEYALFVDLLRTGYRPALAIFMDGVNVGLAEDIPDFSPQVSAAVAAAQTPPSPWQVGGFVFRALPVSRVRDAIRVSLARRTPSPYAGEDPRMWTGEYIETAARRFAMSRTLTRAVAREFGVEVRFFLQPNALVDYAAENYRRPLPPRQLAGRDRARKIYDRLRAQEGAVDLSYLFDRWGARRKAIVDYLHYSPGFNRLLAEEVARLLDVSELRRGADFIAPTRATGQPRRAA